jgi:TetR/AcrR family transcriptional regulator, cholesterol catabolism regulator
MDRRNDHAYTFTDMSSSHAEFSGRPDGAKRTEILDAATRRFGRDGYENTRWADIASDVGVGPTALYHYFESKQHCLFVILGQAVADFRARFDRLAGEGTRRQPDTGRYYLETLIAVLRDCFRLTEQEIQRNRVLVAEQGLLANVRESPREEQARQAAREQARDLERAWAAFLAGAMERGAIPRADAQLLARAILGLYNSVWHWYRPDGTAALPHVAGFFTMRSLALAGAAPDAAASALPVG